jgi:hypothetical protein
MIWQSQAGRIQRLSVSFGALLSVLALAQPAAGQGCMPLHFAFPGLAGQQVSYFQAHDWQIGVAFRRLTTDRFFVGTAEDEAAAPGGQPLNLALNSLDLSITYATSEQFSMTLTVPISYTTIENAFADGQRHQNSSSGVGDINLIGNLWVASPTKSPNGNLSVGLGVLAPTGRYHVTGNVYDSLGNVSQKPLTQTNQPGEGGWAILLQTQAFHQIFPRTSAYLSGSYVISLREHTDVLRLSPYGPGTPPVLTAVPDAYSARLGLAYLLMAEPGLSVSLGGRIDGTMNSDLVGGHTDFYRSAGYTAYVDPGVSLQLGPSQFSLSVPVRVHHDYLTRTFSNGQTEVGRGGVNDFVIYAGYTWRF